MSSHGGRRLMYPHQENDTANGLPRGAFPRNLVTSQPTGRTAVDRQVEPGTDKEAPR
jgi:hypothetical protein